MELTLDQALQKGIEAHKAGKVQEADRYYTAILKANPKHPDANHNMGVLAVGVGKVLEALPFFKTALEVNPNIVQYWLSYIDALIKLDRMDEARAAFDQAKSHGVGEDGLGKLEEALKAAGKVNKKASSSENLLKDKLKFLVSQYEQGDFHQVFDQVKLLTKQFPEVLILWNLMGVTAAETGRIEQAYYAFKKAIDINPKHPDAYNNLGNVLKDQDKLEEARKAYTKAISIKPDYADAYNNMGIVLRHQGKPDEAIAAYNRALSIKRDYAEAYYNLGNVLKEQGKPDEAIAAYNKALSIKPNYAEAHNNMGVALKDQGKLEEAIATYLKVLSIKPNYAEAYNNMGIVCKDQGKLEEASGAYNKALSIRPNYAEAYYNLGNVLNDQGKLEEAIEAYNKALSIKSDYADAYNNMGVALKEQGKPDEAIAAYNKALAIKPNYAEAHNNMGNALKDQRKLNEARCSYTKALTIKPDYAEAYFNMGNTLTSQGKFEEAIEAYISAISIKPDYAVAHNNMGNALHNLGLVDKAKNAYTKALSVQPEYAEVYWNLAGTGENVSTAKHYLEKCLQVNPDYLKAKITMTALHLYEGNEDEFNALMNSSLKDHEFMRSVNWVFSLPTLPPVYFQIRGLFNQMIELSKKDRPFYEFGVWRGEAFKHLIKTYKKGYGFDTFEGLPEDWHDESAGTYTSDGNIPIIDGGEFIVGKFEDTLPGFFAESRPMASIINFDADLYSSTICALINAKPVIDKHTILIFDEFIMNKYWEQDEYKALEEFCALNQFTYEVLAVSFFTKQVAVRLIGV